MTETELIKRAGKRMVELHSQIGRGGWITSALSLGQVNKSGHLSRAASHATQHFNQVFSEVAPRIQSIDARLAHQQAALAQLRSGIPRAGASSFAANQMAGIEKEINALTRQRQSLLSRAESAFDFMHKHHFNAAAHVKAPGVLPDLSLYESALNKLRPKAPVVSDKLMPFIKRHKELLALGGMGLLGATVYKKMRNSNGGQGGYGQIPYPQVM